MHALMLLALLCGADPRAQEQALRKELFERFEQERTWEAGDPAVQRRLDRYLAAAEKERDGNLLQYLAENRIDHDAYPPPLKLPKGMAEKDRYPVVALFVRLGVTYVPFLLDRIKEPGPKEEPERADRKRAFLFRAIREIYEEAGEGQAMAVYRVLLEIENATSPEKERLRRCLPKPPAE